MAKRRPAFTVQNFAQVQHDAKGSHLFGELLVNHHQMNLPVIPTGTRVVINGRKGNMTVIMFPHDVVNDPMKSFTDGDMRVVDWSNIRVLGRFNRSQFTGYPK